MQSLRKMLKLLQEERRALLYINEFLKDNGMLLNHCAAAKSLQRNSIVWGKYGSSVVEKSAWDKMDLCLDGFSHAT